ncbi:right-handed parallel beta-helix repeat-containing protein [Micromonospora sp. NPDC048999]|uniref:DUF7910 domain-containing protein n=1 Tax=Micromonospora sp. NPDC048999 TaxID=3155391 RepID=UPI00340C3EB6
MTSGLLLSTAPAQAAEPTVLYVRQLVTGCSNTGPGTLDRPFCSIKPAAAIVTAGQTVDIGRGEYNEHLTITTSGTPDQPIVFRSWESNRQAALYGPKAAITIDGQHDIKIQGLSVAYPADLPALDLRNASGIEIENSSFSVADGSTVPAVRLAGVTRSSIRGLYASVCCSGNPAGDSGGQSPAAVVTLDATTTGVSLNDLYLAIPGDSYGLAKVKHSVGIRVEGPGNSILNSRIWGSTDAAIVVEAGATGTLVVNNEVAGGAGYGIHNHGASGTAITNNTVQDRCRDGIRVDGSSSRVSVQNNLLIKNSYFGQVGCEPSAPFGVEIGVYDAATRDIVVDYNNADHSVAPSSRIYAWNGTQMSLAAFRAASGQASHDRETGNLRDSIDSANSAAPGFQATDRVGRARFDDPWVPNTGAGPITYADRGAMEIVQGPEARFTVALNPAASSVTVDASSSKAGHFPIASYRFGFSDGTTVTQKTPVLTHRFKKLSTPRFDFVQVQVTDTDGQSHLTAQELSLLPHIGTLGLLSRTTLRYVSPTAATSLMRADHATLDASSQFDLVDAGSGQVALYSRKSNKYVTAEYPRPDLTLQGIVVTAAQRFTLTRNADGTISLKSVDTGRYVGAPSASAALVANATTIGTREKFYRVTVADAGRSLKARANNRFVSAEKAGKKSLIASRTKVGAWERFDLVDLGNGQVALFARANNRFVSAEKAGKKSLIANRLSVGGWEKFKLVRNSDGTVSLKAVVNNRYVTVQKAGKKSLIANRTKVGTWEKFKLGS